MDKKVMEVAKAVTILKPPQTVYSFWRDFGNLPRFMHHLERVEVREGGRSHWWAKKPGGGTVEWDAELTEDTPNEAIAWRSVGDDDEVRNAGMVRFLPAPGRRGTEVHVRLWYDPPAGKFGKVMAELLGEEPGQQVEDDLRRFKQYLEVGEVTRSDAALVGVGQGIAHQDPAQPHATHAAVHGRVA